MQYALFIVTHNVTCWLLVDFSISFVFYQLYTTVECLLDAAVSIVQKSKKFDLYSDIALKNCIQLFIVRNVPR